MADRLTLPQPGDVIAGKYRIDCAIGTGGMGAVYQATHRVTGKRFALKWLLPQVSTSGDAAQRFIREAQVAGRFEHPNVVEVYDVGSEGDSFYMVMELLEGESLAERVDRSGPLSAAEACELLIPCLRGIAEAHAAGIVHRDLKPANIFICHAVRSMAEHAKVLDFGISKMSGAPGGELGEGMTKSGTLIGTPHYMPLEQMRGRAVDHRADIYAFGVVMYQVLSGNLPYPADSFSDLVLALAHASPQPLEEIVALPRGLSDVIMRAMAREADDRYQSIEELIEALDPYAAGEWESIPPRPSTGRRSLDSSLSLPTPLSTESRLSQRMSAPAQPTAASGTSWVVGIGLVMLLIAGAVAGFAWMRRGHVEVAAQPEQPTTAAAGASDPPASAASNVQATAPGAPTTPGAATATPSGPEDKQVPSEKPTAAERRDDAVKTLNPELTPNTDPTKQTPTPSARRNNVARANELQRAQRVLTIQPQPLVEEEQAADHDEIPVNQRGNAARSRNRVPTISETDFY